jgi:ubiquinone/menaquinone biosynthesis C-methylase UbiE
METLEEEYTPSYCMELEAAYGTGMMSEGGREGIEHMFEQIPLNGKKALDIGCGLGGVAFYLAGKYKMHITGLEVNPWMVKESQKRIPEVLRGHVDFILSQSNAHWPFNEESFDLLYSKGVLTHIEIKDELFQECFRVSKPGGLFVITDWLSSDTKKWGENIAKLVELEKIPFYPESESGYIELLNQSGFDVISVRDDSSVYETYNRDIAKSLQRQKRENFLSQFDEQSLKSAIEGYQSIIKALEVGEVRILRFVAKKMIS